jgi:hypothetical protein
MKNRYFTWPKTSLDCERFRYETCHEGLAALTQPASQYEMRGRLKKAFVSYRQEFRKNFFDSMSELIEIDRSIEEQFDKLMLDAVRMWLMFCTQRCRLLISLPGPTISDLSDSEELARQGNIMFTSKPELQRYGNGSGTGTGLDLDMMTVVVVGVLTSPSD